MSNSKGISQYDVIRLFEHNVAGIYETTLDGRLLNFNSAFAEFMGFTEHDLSEVNGVNLYYDEKDREDFIKTITNEGLIRNREVRYRKKDNSVVWCI